MKIENTQYKDFILTHVLRPFQNMLGIDKTIENIKFKPNINNKTFNYFDIQKISENNQEWFNLVIERLSKCFESCDYSFFPSSDTFANTLKKKMIDAGIENNSPFE